MTIQCEFKNCKQEAFTCGNVIVYTKDGDFDTICLCKKHALMLVPKKLRDYVKSKEYPHWLESKIPPEKQIERLQQMIDIIKSHTPTLLSQSANAESLISAIHYNQFLPSKEND